jgi:hypothetical protein
MTWRGLTPAATSFPHESSAISRRVSILSIFDDLDKIISSLISIVA